VTFQQSVSYRTDPPPDRPLFYDKCAACAEVASFAGTTVSKGEYSLVIVEDEPVISLLIEVMAVDLGWRVEGCAYSEAAAFSLLDRASPDVVLLDVNFGSGDSLDVARSCRSRGIPVVFVTGYADAGLLRSFGPAPILPKPFTSEDLARALAAGLARRTGDGADRAPAAPSGGAQPGL